MRNNDHMKACRNINKQDQEITILDPQEVSKNAFGMLSMILFLLTLLVGLFLPLGLALIHITSHAFTVIVIAGFGLSFLFEVIALVICHQHPDIDKKASGVNYGSTAMFFSLFLLLAKLAGIY